VIALEPRQRPSAALALLSPVIAIGSTLAAGAVMLAAMGRRPDEALYVYFARPFVELWWYAVRPEERAMWIYTPSEVVVKAVPLALIGAGLVV
jgi:general nucleoside transport system permease protein